MIIEEEIYKAIIRLRRGVTAKYFRYPVDVRKLKCHDYYTIIKDPIDLSTIKYRFRQGYYKNIEQLYLDCERIITNSRIYNKPHTLIYQATFTFEKRLHQEFLNLALLYHKMNIPCERPLKVMDFTELDRKSFRKQIPYDEMIFKRLALLPQEDCIYIWIISFIQAKVPNKHDFLELPDQFITQQIRKFDEIRQYFEEKIDHEYLKIFQIEFEQLCELVQCQIFHMGDRDMIMQSPIKKVYKRKVIESPQHGSIQITAMADCTSIRRISPQQIKLKMKIKKWRLVSN